VIQIVKYPSRFCANGSKIGDMENVVITIGYICCDLRNFNGREKLSPDFLDFFTAFCFFYRPVYSGAMAYRVNVSMLVLQFKFLLLFGK